MFNHASRAALAVALAVLFTLGCRRHTETPPQTLNEFSSAQLRVFLKSYTGDWRNDTDQSRGIPAPPISKPVPPGSAIIDLADPDTITIGNTPLARAVRQRRSRREYTDASLTNEELSFLLWCTQGVSSLQHDADGNIVNQFRTVPSGGARHPFETYLLVNRVEGLTPGLYRFLPFKHKLCLLSRADNLPEQVEAACYGQSFMRQAAVVFVWSAIPYRTEWRYGYIAHRMIAMEAGHICQNLYLAAESIDAGTCAVLGYAQTQMDALIDVDGHDEFTIYVAAVGKVPVP